MPDRHIGAGVVGCSIAFFLTDRGYRVTLIDRKGIVEETRWLFDPLRPLSVQLACDRRLSRPFAHSFSLARL